MNRLNEIRKEKGFSVSGLCKRLGISNRTYYKYCSGEWAIPSDCLCALTEIFDVSSDYILGLKDYQHVTITDNDGTVLADIGQHDVIESNGIKVYFCGA